MREFFLVDNKVFDYKLRPIAFIVYCYLLKCNNAKHGCFPSKATIAKSCGVALSSVDKAPSELVGKGMVEVEHRFGSGHQQSNMYKLHDLKDLWLHHYRYSVTSDAPSGDYELPF